MRLGREGRRAYVRHRHLDGAHALITYPLAVAANPVRARLTRFLARSLSGHVTCDATGPRLRSRPQKKPRARASAVGVLGDANRQCDNFAFYHRVDDAMRPPQPGPTACLEGVPGASCRGYVHHQVAGSGHLPWQIASSATDLCPFWRALSGGPRPHQSSTSRRPASRSRSASASAAIAPGSDRMFSVSISDSYSS